MSRYPANAGLYVHVPFCVRKCPYCDFYSISDSRLHGPYVAALEQEMKMRGAGDHVFDTLYLGGGTPSVLDAGTICRMIDSAGENFHILKQSEMTLEVNPGTVDLKKLMDYRQAGINRINIGLQSFEDDGLRFLGRIHTAREARQAARWTRKAGFEDMGFDLIYGIPGQTRKDWLADLKQAVDFEPEHLSCYMLTYEPGTHLTEKKDRGQFKPLDDERVSDLFLFTVDFLDSRGYIQYEISNFAREGAFKSKHNRKYWSFVPYLGLGPSAHSFVAPERSWNHPNALKYIDALSTGFPPPGEREVLTRRQMMTEAVYLGLRQTRGIDLNLFQNLFQVDFQKTFKKKLDQYQAMNWVRMDDRHCGLTPRGMLRLDAIAVELVSHEY